MVVAFFFNKLTIFINYRTEFIKHRSQGKNMDYYVKAILNKALERALWDTIVTLL